MNHCDQITRDCEVIENLSLSCVFFYEIPGLWWLDKPKLSQPPVSVSANDISAEYSRIHSPRSAIRLSVKDIPRFLLLTLSFTRNRSDRVAKA